MTKSKKVQSRNAQVHIRIVNPKLMRRTVLRSALDTGRLIKEMHEIHSIRERKYKTLKKLTRVLKEIKSLEKQLSLDHMPKFIGNEVESLIHHHKQVAPHPAHHTSHSTEVKHKEPHSEKKKVSSKPKSETDRLRDELKAIEDKLKMI